MNSELEAYLATVRNRPVPLQHESEQRRLEREEFPARFLAAVDSTLNSSFESAAETLHRHGFGATVELVREQAGSDLNSFPYIVLHFSPQPCPPSDLGYIYTLAGASLSFFCRRNDLCVEAVVAHPAGCGVERRVNFYTLSLEDLTPERVTRIINDAVKQIIRR